MHFGDCLYVEVDYPLQLGVADWALTYRGSVVSAVPILLSATLKNLCGPIVLGKSIKHLLFSLEPLMLFPQWCNFEVELLEKTIVFEMMTHLFGSHSLYCRVCI